MDNVLFTDLMGYSSEDIAEESIHEMKMVFKDKKPEIDKIIEEAKASKDDPKKMIKCYKEALMLLQDLKTEVSGLDKSAFDKATFRLGYAITIIGEIYGLFKLSQHEEHSANLELNPIKGQIHSIVGGAAMGYAGGKIRSLLKARYCTKETMIDSINITIKDVKREIQELEKRGYGSMESLVEYFSTMEVATEADENTKKNP